MTAPLDYERKRTALHRRRVTSLRGILIVTAIIAIPLILFFSWFTA